MMGHTTFESIERLIKKCRQQRVARRRQEENQNQIRLAIEKQQQEEEEEQSFQPETSVSHDDAPPLLPYHPHSHKPQRENSVLLKQQRRQQIRLRHYSFDQTDDQTQGKSKLQHRGWSAIQADAADGWHHTLESQQENSNSVV